jgi:hypothetical protein
MLLEKIELEPGEEVLTTVRKHWFVIVMQLLSVAMLFIIPFIAIIILAILPNAAKIFALHTEYRILLTFAVSSWMLCVILIGFNTWTHYFLDLWLITDRRIIVIDQRAFFSRKVSSFRLERLQDIEVEIEGIIATFLDFGTLRAQTASASENDFTSSGLPNPRELQAVIQGATDKRLEVLRHQGEAL